MELIDPTRLPGWLIPHSLAWYQQLGETEGAYLYPWNSIREEPNGESLFDREVMNMVKGRIALDVGCGHGEFALKSAREAKGIVGLDVTDKFVSKGLQSRKANVSFVVGNTKDGLPFASDTFDCAYIRKGPTSAYPNLQKVVRKGGEVLGLHPGESTGKELNALFPNLFTPHSGASVLQLLKDRLHMSGFAKTAIDFVETKEFLQSPLDVLKYRCFGQTPAIFEELQRENSDAVSCIFKEHATDQGLAITFSRYLVRVVV
ncbi:class I SAM-dependent methyltransferase [Planomicrobium sp. CPCC 101110]|uniref:class I SAM-dependent methyltransferase n=1 Tax=Planomicrobium sp. CPCC 101110 TaxID=2599619 RepID=UPI0011B69E04|nr:methyltransferase domain-containing protein [Planomicrobium sp. CPCC 101110]TWT25823.1 methyltransferase domain-containing protein [Planomicrobium sp. CPCC 101110]